METNPLVSIIIPIYNTANYLPKCIESVLAQSYRNIEVLCFIDASPDNSLEVVESYARQDSRIVVINSLTNVKQGGGETNVFSARQQIMSHSWTAMIGSKNTMLKN